ncbi:tRNA(m5U54)methyltransferase [Coemansia sp. RSA 1813]|nr:tRNA(m5U54)methyltransferase [Coemansia sp. RSA 1646]KAJ1770104.1 tRNA(m5U54)methyltransferase [Coemansia sp. RSA 1843]KAJ2089858.1 tRNA(m5U54)methyltransferase [Coemansia sp. RSA 986]KAJ2214757.1 tRNA(m5U54)methyltransferase [Coemansia sp. RSA 487]KAJ2569744.1 tRNA(m5U54)methyltransferase [Coemansia sp. RSA 1813]
MPGDECPAAGAKRPASFSPENTPGEHHMLLPSEAALSAPSGEAPEQKRTKLKHKGKRKLYQVRKSNADGTVLDAIGLLLRTKWKEVNNTASETEVPKTFGWTAEDKQGEASFCRAPPIPAKLTGDDISECEFDVYVHEISERGHGIATREDREELEKLVLSKDRPWAFAVPFVLKGEKVRVRSVRHEWGYTQADLLSVIDKSPMRVDAPCEYFGRCSGCQLQHIGHQDQLKFKREMVKRAFSSAHPIFANLTVSKVIQSPLEFGYRTKLTPHFDIRKDTPPEQVSIGFNAAGQRRVLDIEDCMIGTDAVRRGMLMARQDTKAKMAEYKRGATLLIRETNIPKDDPNGDVSKIPAADLTKDFVLDPKRWVTDVVKDIKFRFPASSFFQNNASILPAFTGYVREELQKWSRLLSDSADEGELQYLIDAYCGSGLFGITCHSGFKRVMGIEISTESISCANNNAKMNGIDNCDFVLGDATKIFEKVDISPKHTAVIIDPPRKGSSPEFLDQLIAYGPRVIVYIACGVPAQARDIAYMQGKGAIIVDGKMPDSALSPPGAVYRIASVQPFDLFPQTYHVENIVTLVREEVTNE